MLATRLATGLTLVAVLLAVLILDERLAPWFPLWFLTVAGRDGALLDWSWSPCSGPPAPVLRATRSFGGTIALVLANWAPHVVGAARSRRRQAAPGDVTTRWRPST